MQCVSLDYVCCFVATVVLISSCWLGFCLSLICKMKWVWRLQQLDKVRILVVSRLWQECGYKYSLPRCFCVWSCSCKGAFAWHTCSLPCFSLRVRRALPPPSSSSSLLWCLHEPKLVQGFSVLPGRQFSEKSPQNRAFAQVLATTPRTACSWGTKQRGKNPESFEKSRSAALLLCMRDAVEMWAVRGHGLMERNAACGDDRLAENSPWGSDLGKARKSWGV